MIHALKETEILSVRYLFLSVMCVALTVTFKSLPSQNCVHVLLYDLFLYCLYLNILPNFNLNTSSLSRDHLLCIVYRRFVQGSYGLLQIKVSFSSTCYNI